MKFAVAAGLLGFVAVAVAQDSSSSSLSAYEQCLEDKCPSNKNDVSCQASCLSNPNPNASMIAETNKCYEGCNGLDYQGAIDCQAKCNEIYNPSGVIVTDHLTPDGFSNDGSSSASTGAESSANTESQASESGAESADSSEAKSENESSGDHESGSEKETSGEEDKSTDTSDHSETDTSGASGVKAALSAVAAVAAVAALF
ncbi:hypothetical protein GGI11_003015 [Coemansia sp. RSA 2049]|nr:hypothetical protein H4217_005739 [Coemansia sp. RSA 1939]KAJ2517932.1 hypothetical protein GGI11_003015 [Coemansia sp. RSA 2049]KAJ2598372.1 hypothetical protein EV177_007542 [Coemansia sp. RSA 1804]